MATSSSWPVPAGAVVSSTPTPSPVSWRRRTTHERSPPRGSAHTGRGWWTRMNRPATRVHRVGVVVHPDRRRAVELREQVETTLGQHGIDVRVTDADRPRAFADGMDLVISLGGDGTMLR